ncbi:MAG: phosphotyrosine protein phosphatase [Cypionkella sp.]|uniref:low molecular weight protein tyrosine phosphatase family protein n=1 Tax=Cypionkella sp. TaxID=2811411 RepID=UPI002ABCA2BE|nr:phosphotyrosine protein phosphatase [Cypionkella sp.]MDZ4313121.1 phosphotyrosine protein phosphatase [Cypionkella sp.]MDZ4395046.1 phosphotyrosine protein phosphatase [Cypionkella sp.]
MTNALFLCGKARMRSPTAADIAARWPGIATDFAGLSHDADEKLSAEQIDWADVIFVMETRQAKRLKSQFPAALRDKRVVVLNIPDNFSYMQPELVDLLTPKLRAVLIG